MRFASRAVDQVSIGTSASRNKSSKLLRTLCKRDMHTDRTNIPKSSARRNTSDSKLSDEEVEIITYMWNVMQAMQDTVLSFHRNSNLRCSKLQ